MSKTSVLAVDVASDLPVCNVATAVEVTLGRLGVGGQGRRRRDVRAAPEQHVLLAVLRGHLRLVPGAFGEAGSAWASPRSPRWVISPHVVGTRVRILLAQAADPYLRRLR
jgi:hypothetical protein